MIDGHTHNGWGPEIPDQHVVWRWLSSLLSNDITEKGPDHASLPRLYRCGVECHDGKSPLLETDILHDREVYYAS